MSRKKPKLIYLVTEDWYFYSHRMPMVQAALNLDFDVAVITNVDKYKAQIEEKGVRVIPLSLERRDLNIFKALGHIKALRKIYAAEKPDIVHHIAMKPILYGSIAAVLARVPVKINAFAGLGYVFSSTEFLARCIRAMLVLMFLFLLKGKRSHVLLQNRDDRALLDRYHLLPEGRTHLIRGSGVNLDHYKVRPIKRDGGEMICAYAGRMIGIKGLDTLQKAFELLKDSRPDVKLWLCGIPDPANPGSWTEDRLKAWDAENDNVAYKGYCDNMPEMWAQVHVAIQVSYGGDGVPKSLLEAAACGRAIIASDVPGCREVVEDGVNGFLVPARGHEALADAIKALADDPERCAEMGKASRTMVEGDMSAEAVTEQTQKLYADCIKGLWNIEY